MIVGIISLIIVIFDLLVLFEFLNEGDKDE